MSVMFAISEIPPLLEIDQPYEVDVEVQHAPDRELHVRAIVRHVHGIERVLESPRRRPSNGTIVDRFVIVAWTEGQHSIVFELRDDDNNVIHSSPPHHYKGARMAAPVNELTPHPAGGVSDLDRRGGGDHQPHMDRVTRVSLQRSSVPQTEDEVLWMAIRRNSENLSYPHYHGFIEDMLCPEDRQRDRSAIGSDKLPDQVQALSQRRSLPFPGVDGYRWLKIATEVFVRAIGGVLPDLDGRDVREAEHRLGTTLHGDLLREPDEALARYLGAGRRRDEMLPYHRIVMEKLQGTRILHRQQADGTPDDGKIEACYGVLESKLMYPCMIELIWSYWQEEGMLVQTMNAISQRFQNRRAAGDRDPLAQLEVDPLRPLNNLLWGYLQDELNGLTVLRRAHEYEHQYGISLRGKAVASLRTAESRSKFLESFHNLLYKCQQFYKQDDDATVIADGFPVLNAIKETHYVLAQGAHNQFGDLPATARQEMLIQQWLLGRPEMREFLGGRVMVPYPEAWMDRVDAMKTLQAWTDTSVVHFNDLATFGERLLLSIRYGAWSRISNRDHAANWARSWRTESQGYIHAYRAVTGVDLATEPSSTQNVEERYLPPSVHLRNRLASQRRR